MEGMPFFYLVYAFIRSVHHNLASTGLHFFH